MDKSWIKVKLIQTGEGRKEGGEELQKSRKGEKEKGSQVTELEGEEREEKRQKSKEETYTGVQKRTERE